MVGTVAREGLDRDFPRRIFRGEAQHDWCVYLFH
jgi:hypothetical protein